MMHTQKKQKTKQEPMANLIDHCLSRKETKEDDVNRGNYKYHTTLDVGLQLMIIFIIHLSAA